MKLLYNIFNVNNHTCKINFSISIPIFLKFITHVFILPVPRKCPLPKSYTFPVSVIQCFLTSSLIEKNKPKCIKLVVNEE